LDGFADTRDYVGNVVLVAIVPLGFTIAGPFRPFGRSTISAA
jgi:hypothetical protein